MSLRAQQLSEIVPLHSTRADVERLLGPSDGKVLGIYKLENEVVSIQYTEGRCDRKNGQDWNVPPSTVVEIVVAPRSSSLFSDLSVDKTKLQKKDDPHLPGITYYVDEDAGITYQVSVVGTVTYVSYGPKAEDMHLRCPTSSAKKSCRQ
jgi:hypothetical protein